MDEIFKIMAAVLLANMLTAWFLYAAFHLNKIYEWDDASFAVLCGWMVPLGFLILTFLAYG